jgi:hypothetical protein
MARIPRFVAALFVCVLFVPVAKADTTLNFLQALQIQPNTSYSPGSSSVSIDGFTITAFYWNGSQWAPAYIWYRNDTAPQSVDHGIGDCNPNEDCQLGDQNELSDEIPTRPEIIQISKPSNQAWTGVGLSSLDFNGGNGSSPTPEMGQVFASNSGVSGLPSLLVNGSLTSLLCSYSEGVVVGAGCTTMNGGPSNSAVEPNIGFAANTDTYLYLQAYDWTNNGASLNNDYLLRSVTYTPAPEPASLLLLGTGLAGVAGILRRRRGK